MNVMNEISSDSGFGSITSDEKQEQSQSKPTEGGHDSGMESLTEAPINDSIPLPSWLDEAVKEEARRKS